MGLELEEVAEILHLPCHEIEALMEKGDIPHYRVGDTIRFSRAEIEDWVLHNKHRLKTQKGNEKHEAPSPHKGRNHYSLFRALHKGNFITQVEAKNKEDFLKKAAEYLAPPLELDPEIFFELLMERESMQSTSVGHGIAIPHARDLVIQAKQDQVSLLFAEKAIDFGALDQKPVSIFFFPFASTDSRHLQLLAKIAFLVADEEMGNIIRSNPSKIIFLEAVEKWEKSLSTHALKT
jgi:nitrogen PTS system EIIA component